MKYKSNVCVQNFKKLNSVDVDQIWIQDSTQTDKNILYK